jgi:phenylacetaldehyde dehydrogenase
MSTTADQAVSAGIAPARRQLFIDGGWVDPADGATFPTINPATEKILAHAARAGVEDVDRAVKAARRAFGGVWGRVNPYQRSQVLWRVGDLILAHVEELAMIESTDVGKPLTMATYEIYAAASYFHYFAGWCDKLTGITADMSIGIPGAEFHRYHLRQPLGVVALITPWNFPLVEASYKIAPALAAGNTVILKPAEQTPLSALRLTELAAEAGLPAGVLNVLTGFGEDAGAGLVNHRGVDKVSFTGSTETGKAIVRGATGNLKRVTLELGGKCPNIIFDDADLSLAIAGSANAGFFNAGEVCTAGSRLYVHERVYDEVVEGLAQAAAAWTVGDPLDPATLMGPLVTEEHFDKVSGYLDIGRSEGATVVAGGGTSRPGYFCEPTLFTTNDGSIRIAREEIFGPVIVAQKFSTLDEVVALANDSDYGLAAGIWTTNLSTAHLAAKRIQAGQVWINNYQLSDPSVSVGGVKQSGWGYDLGHEGINGFTHLKGVVTQLT